MKTYLFSEIEQPTQDYIKSKGYLIVGTTIHLSFCDIFIDKL